MMNYPNYKSEIRRVFLLQDLPEPLTRASEHLQFFDNYIENTRLRLRTIRSPHTKEWQWILEQRFAPDENNLAVWNVSEIFLSEAEHAVFEIFEGRQIKQNERIESNELRFNRYFFETSGKQMEIDVFLNPLWGLYLGKIFFDTEQAAKDFSMPDFAVGEVTQNPFFLGRNLIGKTFADVQEEWKTKNG